MLKGIPAEGGIVAISLSLDIMPPDAAPPTIPPRVAERDPDSTGAWWPPATLLAELAPPAADVAPSPAEDWALDGPSGKTIDLFGPQEMTALEDEEAFSESTLVEGLPSGITLPPLPNLSRPEPVEVVEAHSLIREGTAPVVLASQLSKPQPEPPAPAAEGKGALSSRYAWLWITAAAVACGIAALV